MEESSLVSLLRTFDREEFRRFSRFLQSPYFNNADYILRFFLAVKKFYPQFSGKGFTREKIYASLYPGEKYNDVNMRRLIAELNRLACHFLEIESFNNNAGERKTKLISQLNDRGLQKLHFREAGRLRDLVAAGGFRESYDYYLNYFVQNSFNDYYVTVDNLSDKVDLAAGLRYYTDYFVSELLPKYVSLLGVSKYEHIDTVNTAFLDNIFREIRNNLQYNPAAKNYILISLYYTVYELMLDYFNNEKFFNAEKMVLKHHDKVSGKVLMYFFNELQNYCWVRIYKGDVEFEKILFEFYRAFLETGLFDSGYFPHLMFDNYVSAGLNVQDPDWSLEFINRYKERLNPEVKDNVIAYNLSGVYYTKKDFGKALEELAKVHYLEYSYKMRIKADTIKILYELGENDPALHAIDAIKHFIKNDKKNSKSFNLVFANFAKFTTELIYLKERKNPDGLSILGKKVNDCENLMHKPWLNDKINELIK